MAHEKPNQTIIVFPQLNIWPLSYYYSGINKLLPIPREMGEEKFNLQKIVLKNEQEISAALSQIPGKHQYLWLVSNYQQIIPGAKQQKCEILKIDFNCHIVANFIDKYYSIEHTEEFYDLQVRFMSRKHS